MSTQGTTCTASPQSGATGAAGQAPWARAQMGLTKRSSCGGFGRGRNGVPRARGAGVILSRPVQGPVAASCPRSQPERPGSQPGCSRMPQSRWDPGAPDLGWITSSVNPGNRKFRFCIGSGLSPALQCWNICSVRSVVPSHVAELPIPNKPFFFVSGSLGICGKPRVGTRALLPSTHAHTHTRTRKRVHAQTRTAHAHAPRSRSRPCSRSRTRQASHKRRLRRGWPR